MNKTKIDWCDSTWNPVTGCLHGCEYCYARAIAERFRERKGYEVNADNTIFIHHFDGSPTIYELKEPCFLEEYDPFGEKRNRDKIKAPYPYGFKPTFHRYKMEIYIIRCCSEAKPLLRLSEIFSTISDFWEPFKRIKRIAKAPPLYTSRK